jgi:hypothetical protein
METVTVAWYRPDAWPLKRNEEEPLLINEMFILPRIDDFVTLPTGDQGSITKIEWDVNPNMWKEDAIQKTYVSIFIDY